MQKRQMGEGREKGKGGHGLGSAKGEVDDEEAKSEVALALYASESDGLPRSRKDILSFAKLAEKSNCDDDLLIAANHLVDLSKKRELDNEERNLVSIAYKLYVGKRRTAWQALVPIRAQWGEYKYGHSNSPSADPESDIRASWTDDYIHKIEQELEDICAEINLIIEEKLLPTSGSMEGKVFFRKMAADYCRYLAEFRAGEHRKEAGELALRNYKLASALAENHLRATNPVRLGLALNFSVFYYEILGFHDRARHLANVAYDEALATLDGLPEEHYQDSTVILQLLRDNLQIWAQEARDAQQMSQQMSQQQQGDGEGEDDGDREMNVEVGLGYRHGLRK